MLKKKSPVSYLISHYWKETRRSPMWHRNLIVNIILGVSFFFVMLNFLFLGFFADKVLLKLFPGQDPVDVFNSGLLYYFGIELFTRFWVQSLPGMNVIPYLHLPVKRATLMHYLLGRSLSNLLNYISFLIFIPFSLKVIAGAYTASVACCWLLTMLLCVIFANLTVVYIKRQLASKIWVALAWIIVFALLFGADYLDVFSLSDVSGRLFGGILTTSWFLLVPALLVAGVYVLNYRFLLSHTYPNEYNPRSRQETTIANFHFANRFGTIGRMIAVELKLIMRNKRTRMILFTPLFIIFYGFFILERPGTVGFMRDMWGVMSTGVLMMGYGQMPFDGRYFDGVLIRNSVGQYIRTKYILYVLMCLFSLVLCIPQMCLMPATVLIFLSGAIYNIGINTIIMVYCIGYGRESIALGQGSSMNWQGVKAYQFVTVLLIMFLPTIIAAIFQHFGNAASFLSLAIPGLLGILLAKPLLNICIRHTARQKYAMAEGFRQRR